MAITDFAGALIIHGQQPAVNGMVPDYNQNAAPSMAYQGMGLLDPRFGYKDAPVWGYRALGFTACADIPVIDAVPYTATTNNIAASQTSVAGTPLTLVSTSGAGITVLATAQQIFPSGVTLPVGTLAIDGAQNILQFGTANDIGVYDPATMLSRCLVLTNNSNETTTGRYLVSGYDVYGYPMSQLLTAPNNSTVNTTKAFKYITSILPTGAAIGSTATTVGTIDTIGLPIATSFFGDLRINGAAATGTLVTAVTGYTGLVATSPATTTTGDVRGTYALQSASNNSIRIQVKQTPRPTLIQANAITGLFGVTQV